MIIKLLTIAFLISIIYTMMSGLIFLLKDDGKSTRLVKSLTWRVALSATLFCILLVLHVSGMQTLHGLTPAFS